MEKWVLLNQIRIWDNRLKRARITRDAAVLLVSISVSLIEQRPLISVINLTGDFRLDSRFSHGVFTIMEVNPHSLYDMQSSLMLICKITTGVCECAGVVLIVSIKGY